MKTLAPIVLWVFLASGLTNAQIPLRVGDPAPDFTLPGATKDTIFSAGISLRSFIRDRVVVLAFYPADWSGGCTKEMCTLRDNFAALGELGATVFGISGDYVYSHREWAKHLDLPFTLLSDHDHAFARVYSSYQEGRGTNARTVYVIDSGGAIAYIDLAYKSSGPESFNALKRALASIH